MVQVPEVRFPRHPRIDVAVLVGALRREKREFFPILRPETLSIGEGVYTFGYFVVGGAQAGPVEQGYFAGKIINFLPPSDDRAGNSFTVPFAVLEGMSGSPVLTYHSGVKVVGMAYGNRASRILASEVLNLEQPHQIYRETVHRLVEFGAAYHSETLIAVLRELGIDGIVVSDQRVAMPGLD